ncbi:MAG: hypothetical protein KIS84_05880 [Dokdonella sp.]|nr:hypothetical protein [Dokdonella sp.]
MPITPILIALYVFAGLSLMFALANLFGARRRWRARRRFAACHSSLWGLVFTLVAVLAAVSATALLGYRRLAAETEVATLATRQLAERRYEVRIEYPDGTRRSVELAGDQWQLDARVIKWRPAAVVLGAPALYRLDRLSGRVADARQAADAAPSLVALGGDNPLDPLDLKRLFPRWTGWIDADYGSAAYLPLVDGGRYRVSLAAAGGLVARPADAATEQKLRAAGW